MTGRLRTPVLLGLVAALSACTPSAPAPETTPAAVAAPPAAPASTAVASAATPAAAVVTGTDLSQVGTLRIGAPFGKAPGDEAFVSAGMREAMEGDCEYYDKGSLPDGMAMMVIADRIARFEVDATDDPGVRVTAPPAGAAALPYGLWVGMTVAEAKQRLPDGVVTSPHAYNSPNGEYLTWTDKAAKLALRLETLDGLITSIYWGQPDAVELIEGCA
ncbi:MULTISPECIES: hypothetical protein [Stenotrophomonas]|uniref:hypothetical protein n=1 Tax=Stenotrophomonas TaxID=40323 RepID=UPI0007705206|nr:MULTISPECIES: hypothetical protein [Stenotrophomonas]AMJ57061.1 hypothetical protein AXG53_10710 [Stenotrophomonas sp. KCTC 12332]